jgi:hypothetical protein
MKHDEPSMVLILLVLSVMLGTCYTNASSTITVSSREQGGGTFDGQILFAPFYSTTTYLVDNAGRVRHTWATDFQPDASAYWVRNGTILRPLFAGNGGLQTILWNGTVAWDYRYNVSGCTCHHDIQRLPNGNVLMIVWEAKTINETIAAGRDPDKIHGSLFTPDKIIEVKPTGPSSGEVVWEWHVWDHLIQDYDATKANYGVVGDHPELIDINFGDSFVGDWLHTNSVDYNPQFDQILIDVHNFNEVWVIDHSTNTEQAAGHSGGLYGHGGDLLYRWGNPEAYRRGNASDQRLFGQHDASWIRPGFPGEGDILVFNNGFNRPGSNYSSVDEITPPVDADGVYYLAPGSAYGPGTLTWTYSANPPTAFYSQTFGGTLRLKDGNTLICDGNAGVFFEVTPENTIIWQWTNPYPSPTLHDVFKIDYIPPEGLPRYLPKLEGTGSLSWSKIKPGATVYGSFQVKNVGDDGSLLNWTVHNTITWGTWTFTPASGEDLMPEQGSVTVQVTLVAPNEKHTKFQGVLTVCNKNNASDFSVIPVTLRTSATTDLPPSSHFLIMIRYLLSFLTDHLQKLKPDFFPSHILQHQLFYSKQ